MFRPVQFIRSEHKLFWHGFVLTNQYNSQKDFIAKQFDKYVATEMQASYQGTFVVSNHLLNSSSSSIKITFTRQNDVRLNSALPCITRSRKTNLILDSVLFHKYF